LNANGCGDGRGYEAGGIWPGIIGPDAMGAPGIGPIGIWPGIMGIVCGGAMPGIPPIAGNAGAGVLLPGHVPCPWKKPPGATGPISGGGIMKLLPHIGHWNNWPTCDGSPCKTCPWGQQNWNDMFSTLFDGLRCRL
jgi:hypothetical protein